MNRLLENCQARPKSRKSISVVVPDIRPSESGPGDYQDPGIRGWSGKAGRSISVDGAVDSRLGRSISSQETRITHVTQSLRNSLNLTRVSGALLLSRLQLRTRRLDHLYFFNFPFPQKRTCNSINKY